MKCLDFHYDLALSVNLEEHAVFDGLGDRLNTSEYDQLLSLIAITGINVILYCTTSTGSLLVRNMYYLDGQSWMSHEFMTKYLTGMGLQYDLYEEQTK